MKTNVHIYAVVRVKISDVEAETPKKAARKAEELVNLHDILDGRNGEYDIEWAEEVTGFTVDPLDEDGEVMYDQMKNYDAQEIET